MNVKKIISVGMMIWVFGGAITTHAEPIPLMNKKQLTGCYERINFSAEFAKQMNPTEYWLQPYQWFCFKRDGKFFNVMSSHYQRHTVRSLGDLDLSQSRYDFLSKGMIKIEGEDMMDDSYWQISSLRQNITMADGTILPKNTLVMGLVDPRRGTVVYWRYLKKL